METRADTRVGCYPQCVLIGSPLTEIPVVQRTDPYPFNSYLYCSELARPPLSLSPSPPTSLLAYLPPRLSPSSSLYSSLAVGPPIVGDVWYIVGDGAIYGKFFFSSS